jgi:CRP-like cAMP-binding protein
MPYAAPTLIETRNTLLASLPEEEQREIAPLLQPFPLVAGAHLHDAGDEIRHLYFIERGLVSLITVLEDGTSIEVGLAGREGASGLSALLGAETATHLALVQMEGRALRMRAEDAREAFRRHEEFRRGLLGYARSLLSMTAQTAACNALHTIEERLARWLLLCWQRGGSDVLPLTHEMLSQMLGVRRSGVTVAAGALQRAGLIRYTRKDIVLLDRAGLEVAACECFRSMSAEASRHLVH